MTLLSLPIFTWPIDWTQPVNGRWNFDLREFALGFGPELTDIQQDHVVHGWDFTCDFRNEEVDDVEAFLNERQGRARPFWMPGPSAQFRIEDGDSSTRFIISEQGAASGWQLHPGGYVWLTKVGEAPQVARITAVSDLGNGTERVTIEQVNGPSVESSASSSSTAASVSSSSSSSSRSSQSSSSSSTLVSKSSSSSEGNSSLSSLYPESTSSSSDFQDIDETWQVFPLFLVRLADDQDRVEICAERWQRRTFRVVELPHDYDVIESAGETVAPDAPVYLYKFTAPLPGGSVEWRFTSHPTDVVLEAENLQSSSSSETTNSESSQSDSSQSTASSASSVNSSQSTINSSSSTRASETSSSSSQTSASSSSSDSSVNSSSSSGPETTWLAVGIEHSKLSRSTKLGGTVTITADIDNVEPLRLLVPMRLSVPLRVQIIKTNTRFEESEIVFTGIVRRPEVVGRKISVQCVEWGAIMDQRIPNFFIQRNCNYRIYDPQTCRADASARIYDIDVVAASGRLVTIQPASFEVSLLHNTPENWFAGGWIEIGGGINRRAFYVMSHPANGAVAQVRLTLSAAFDLEVPATGTILPGCDGRRSTCISKFNNLVNFGGHATPRDNLTLAAIKTNARGGKK